MKTLTVLLATTLLLAAAARAQDAPKRERPSGPSADRMLGFFGLSGQRGETLKLTDEQKKKAVEIAQRYRPQLEDIHKKMMADFRTILTDEQKKKVDEIMEQRHHRSPQGRGESGRKPGGDAGKK